MWSRSERVILKISPRRTRGQERMTPCGEGQGVTSTPNLGKNNP